MPELYKEVLARVAALRAEGKTPHGLLRELAIEAQLWQMEQADKT